MDTENSTSAVPCRSCTDPAVVIDLDYDEGYCQRHWDAQQRSSEPVEYFRYLDPH